MEAPALRVGLPCAGGQTSGRLVALAVDVLRAAPTPFAATSLVPRAPKVQIQLQLTSIFVHRCVRDEANACCCIWDVPRAFCFMRDVPHACCCRCYLLVVLACHLLSLLAAAAAICLLSLLSAAAAICLLSLLAVVKIMVREILWIGLMIISHIYVN
jgi:hypothetical protein